MPWGAGKPGGRRRQAWYPGQEGGTAVAEVLFGDVNPAGRLPVTFYSSTADLPSFTDYSMASRTYRYFSGKPLFAFGHGLSYTTFDYKSVRCDRTEAGSNEAVHVSLEVANTGARDGDEVVQVYFRHLDSAVPQALEALCGFGRVSVAHGKSTPVDIQVPGQAVPIIGTRPRKITWWNRRVNMRFWWVRRPDDIPRRDPADGFRRQNVERIAQAISSLWPSP